MLTDLHLERRCACAGRTASLVSAAATLGTLALAFFLLIEGAKRRQAGSHATGILAFLVSAAILLRELYPTFRDTAKIEHGPWRDLRVIDETQAELTVPGIEVHGQILVVSSLESEQGQTECAARRDRAPNSWLDF